MSRSMRIADLADLAAPWGPDVSPDGTVAYTLRTVDAESDRTLERVWRVGPDRSPVRLTRGDADGAPAWSPDGERLAFLRGGDGPGQLWCLPADGGEAEQLTHLPLGAGAPQWSPDGSRIAFAAPVDIAVREGGERRASRRHPARQRRGRVPGRRLGAPRHARRHLHVVDLASGECRRVTTGDWHVAAFAWSPDGTRLAFSADPAADRDLHTRLELHVVDALTPHASVRRVGLEGGTAQALVWTPDGGSLVVVGTVGDPAGHAHLLRVPLDGGAVADLAGSLDRNVMAGGPGYPGATPVLTDDGATVLFCARDRGCTHLFSVPLSGGEPRLVLGGPGLVVSGLSVAGGERRRRPRDRRLLRRGRAAGPGPRRCAPPSPTTGRPCPTSGWPTAPSASSPSRTGARCTAGCSTPRPTGPRPCSSTSTGGRTTPGTGRPTRCTSTTRSCRPRLGRAALNPRGSDGYGEDFFTGGPGSGARRPPGLPGAGRRPRRRGAGRPGPSRGRRVQLRRVHDVRPHRPQRPLRGGRHRRRLCDLTSMAGPRTTACSPTRAGDCRGPTPSARPALADTRVRPGADPEPGAARRARRACPARRPGVVLRAADPGVPTRLVIYPGGGHLFIVDGPVEQRIDYKRRVIEWVERYAGDGSGARSPRVASVGGDGVLTEACGRTAWSGAQFGILAPHPDGGASSIGRPRPPAARPPHGVPVPTTRCSRSVRSARSRRRGRPAARRGGEARPRCLARRVLPDFRLADTRRRASRAPPAHPHQRVRRGRVHRHRAGG